MRGVDELGGTAGAAVPKNGQGTPEGALELCSVLQVEMTSVSSTNKAFSFLTFSHPDFQMCDVVLDLKASGMLSPKWLCSRSFSILIFSIG